MLESKEIHHIADIFFIGIDFYEDRCFSEFQSQQSGTREKVFVVTKMHMLAKRSGGVCQFRTGRAFFCAALWSSLCCPLVTRAFLNDPPPPGGASSFRAGKRLPAGIFLDARLGGSRGWKKAAGWLPGGRVGSALGKALLVTLEAETEA